MTRMLFRDDAYLSEAEATIVACTPAGIVLDQTIFYPQGGGQPGDTGWLEIDGARVPVANTVKGDGDQIVLELEDSHDGSAKRRFEPGLAVRQILDWDRRFRHMRVHTGLHLLSVVIPLGVTGGAISAVKGRLDFDMPEPITNKAELEADLNALIARDLPVTETWITDADLAARPALVKTMSVKPPMGAGRIRLVRIGDEDVQVDLQPCGGTHIRSTAEIGRVTLGKIEKKSARNRRVNMVLS